MFDQDISMELNRIIEQYKTSPFGFRLRRTGSILKLIEYNGLLYIDNDNLYKVVNELLGPNIPERIKDYLPKITFSEIIMVETENFKQSLRLTCIQFIDYSFFNKCKEWLNDINEIRRGFEHDQFLNTNCQNISNDNFYFNFIDDKNLTVDEMYPFKPGWRFDGLELPQNMNEEEHMNSLYHKESIISRPRGKQMQVVKGGTKERPFVCDVPMCERAFKRYEHLKRHMKMHTGDKPYKCKFPNCSKSFSRSDNLSQHMKTHSLDIKQSESIRFRNSQESKKEL